jgi:hypothetical protein
MLKNNADWSRPIYYATTVDADLYLRLDPYFRRDGVAYRIMPFVAANHEPVNTDILYDNLLHKYRYGNLEEQGLYLDENSARMAKTFRILFGLLTKNLADKGDTIRTKEALDYCLKVIPSYNIPYDFYSTGELAESYDKIGETEKAAELYKELAELSLRNLNWYSRLKAKQYAGVIDEVRRDLTYLQYILPFFQKNDPELYKQYFAEQERYFGRYEQFMILSQQQQPRGGYNR